MKAPSPLDENDKRRLILKLVTRLRCVGCGQPYAPQDFVLIERRQDVWVLGVHCRHCGSSGHVIVVMRSDAESEPVTDLTAEESRVVDQWPPITADDVLDVHELLQEFDGDLGALFIG